MRNVGKIKTKSIIIQVVLALPILTVLLALLSAKLVLSGTVTEERLQLCAWVYTALIGFLGALYCSLRMPQKKLLWGLLAAVAYLCMLLVSNLLFFGIGYGDVLGVTCCVMGGGLFGSLLGASKRKKYR